MKNFFKAYQMINKSKVVNEIKNDGRYDAILDVVKKSLGTNEPTIEQISGLVEKDPFYITEYKDLNRWGELSSIHIHELEVKDEDSSEVKSTKEQINENVVFLRNREEYQIPSKNTIYIAWTGFIALPAIYVIDNIVRLATDLYIDGKEESVYISFALVLMASTWAYLKVKNNHTTLHKKYVETRTKTRELIKSALEKNYFTLEEVYQV